MPNHRLQKLLKNKSYSKNLVGYAVHDKQLGVLGSVYAIHTPPQQHLLVVKYQDRELLIPYHVGVVEYIDHQKKCVFINLPEDFLTILLLK